MVMVSHGLFLYLVVIKNPITVLICKKKKKDSKDFKNEIHVK